MKQRMMGRIAALSLSVVLPLSAALSLSGCGAAQSVQTEDLLADLEVSKIQAEADLTGSGADAAMDFSVRLFQETQDAGQNTLLSPLSAMYALSMTANGAGGETLSQMEATLGMSVQQLNEYLCTYMQALPSEEKSRLHLADSIWLRDAEEFQPQQEFRETVAEYYDASVYKAAFNSRTLNEINAWIKQETDGKIPEILSKINDDAVMYLINALSFDAEWANPYTPESCSEGVFTCEDGSETDAEFMYSQEYRYLEDEHATGFLKYYYDHNYAFAALLPEEGMTVAEYVDSLTGEDLRNLLSGSREVPVDTALPKFEAKYSTDLSEPLQNMGIIDAFSSADADFSGIGVSEDGPLYISKVLHKTFLSLDEQGTEAGAATAVEMASGSAMSESEEPKEVILDRPFLYLIIDCSADLPLFIGTAQSISHQ